MAVGGSEGALDSREVVQASEILAKIERGEPVEYDVVIVEGDLGLSNLDLPTEHVDRTYIEIKYKNLAEEVKVVNSPISITNSEIRGKIVFDDVLFREPVIFKGTKFSSDVAGFWRVQFRGDANFEGAKFRQNANFREAEFGGKAYFFGTDFGGEFKGSGDFSMAKFSGDALFGGAGAGGNVIFDGVEFGGMAHFRDYN